MTLTELKQIIGSELQEYEPKAGVYFLLAGEEIVYVGQTKDVGHRIRDHQSEGEKDFDRVVFQETPDLKDRLVRESHYIQSCATKYNINLAPYSLFPHPRFGEDSNVKPGTPCFMQEANIGGVRAEQLEQYLAKAG